MAITLGKVAEDLYLHLRRTRNAHDVFDLPESTNGWFLFALHTFEKPVTAAPMMPELAASRVPEKAMRLH
jgi:hypothetical protein